MITTPLLTEVHVHILLLLVVCYFPEICILLIGDVSKMDGKSSGQKVNTHRSKHSETEQRRRSKINERQA